MLHTVASNHHTKILLVLALACFLVIWYRPYCKYEIIWISSFHPFGAHTCSRQLHGHASGWEWCEVPMEAGVQVYHIRHHCTAHLHSYVPRLDSWISIMWPCCLQLAVSLSAFLSKLHRFVTVADSLGRQTIAWGCNWKHTLCASWWNHFWASFLSRAR